MTKEERVKAADEYADGKSSSDVFRQAHIADFLAGAECEAESNKLTVERINKYARHQFNRSALGLDLVSFEEWCSDTTP